jgi:hypothetical protein
MFLKRRKDELEGIHQATTFENKPNNSPGLRTGGYFISLEACISIQSFYKSKSKFNRLNSKAKGKSGAPVSLCTKFSSVPKFQETTPIITKSGGNDSLPSCPAFFCSPSNSIPTTEDLLLAPPIAPIPCIQIPILNQSWIYSPPSQPSGGYTIIYW